MTLIAFHLIQNHAPSNLNRDDNGDPKDTLFGNARRARISSQALKRSIRWNEDFRSAINNPDLLAIRTKRLPEEVKERLLQPPYNTLIDEATRERIIQQTERLGTNSEKDSLTDENSPSKKRETQQLIFLTAKEIDHLVEQLCKLKDATVKRNKKDVLFGQWTGTEFSDKLGFDFEPHAVDIAMFGRMTTSSPFKDIEAAVQVAHAFSTHKIETEFDFFTAVDDRSGESGAGMLGDVAFNSATYYKYINIHWEGLLKNLNNDYELAATAVAALFQATLTAIPSGKQNTFAAHNLPDFALVEVLEKNIPVNYANAFVKPLQPTANASLLGVSINALLDYVARIGAKYELAADRAYFSIQDAAPTAIRECATVGQLSQWLRERIPARQEA